MVDLTQNGSRQTRLSSGFDLAVREQKIHMLAAMDGDNLIPLTLDEHRELGRDMKATAHRLRGLCDLIVNVYGRNNRAAFGFLKTMEAIDRLNQELEAQATRDLAGHPHVDFYR